MPSQSQWKVWVLAILGASAKPVTAHEIAQTLSGRLDPPLEEDAMLRKVSAALRKLGAAEQAVYEAGWGWALTDWRERDAPEPEPPLDDARRAKTEAMILKLQAKADSTSFPHEADSLRAKVLELKAKIAAMA